VWRIGSLLGKHLETNNETTAVAMQRLSKRVPVTTVTHPKGSAPRSYKEENWDSQVQFIVCRQFGNEILKKAPEGGKLNNFHC
jgi:hypothetical protein